MSDLDIEMAPEPNEDPKPQVRFTPFSGVNSNLEVEVSDEPLQEEEPQTETIEEVKAKLEAANAQIAAQQQAGSTADAVRMLAEQMRPQPQTQVPLFLQEAQQVEELSPEEEKKLAEALYEGNLSSTIDRLNERKLGPAKAKEVSRALTLGEKTVRLDPEKKAFYEKYRMEIQQVINNTPLDKLYSLDDPYEAAYNHVMQLHQDEVMKSTLAEQVAAGVEAKMKEMGYTPQNKPAPNQTFTESGQRPGPKAQQATSGKIRLTSAEENDRLRRGMTSGNYDAFLKRNPKYKEMINGR